jgi:IS1 family transposase
MNNLSHYEQVAIISALTEGVSIRSAERLTGSHRDTIMRLGVRVGVGCSRLHDRKMHSLQVNRIELDEIWSFVGKKQRQMAPGDDPATRGDQYVFTALSASSKAILSYRVGKRTSDAAEAFLADLRERVLGNPEISSDAFYGYELAVRRTFGAAVSYGQIVKKVAGDPSTEASRRYSPAVVVAVKKYPISGTPEKICTSYVERSNLTLRMASRRFTRLTNGFSKKLENHAAAVSLFVAHYNFCRVHETTRMTPAMGLGITDHAWSISELIDNALAIDPSDRHPRLRVIDGGRN